MKQFLWIIFTSMFMATATFASEFNQGSQTIAVFGGIGGSRAEYDYQPGSREPVTGAGGAFGAQYLYYVKNAPAIGFGADITSSLNGDRRDDDLLFNTNTTQRLKSVVGMAIARLAYPRGLFRPYLFTGVGVHSSSQQLSGQPATGTWPGGGTEVRQLVDEHKTSAALGYGIGADLFVAESFFLGVELRGTWLAGLDTDDTPALKNAGFNVHEKNGITQGNILFRAGVKF